MKDNDKIPAWVVLVGSIVCLFLGLWFGDMCASAFYTQSAFRAGVAEYRVNPKTGETSFVWITNAPSFKP